MSGRINRREERTMPCYRVCQQRSLPGAYNNMEDMRAWWENWDLRILILFILFTQLYLHVCGRIRGKSASALIIVNVWLLYLFSDLFAIIALGKLSKLKINNDALEYLKQIVPKGLTKKDQLAPPDFNVTLGKDALQVMWAPLILFYLGGPDTITVLRFEENKLWTKHLLGLVMQGLRTAYALIATLFFPGSLVACLALLLCIPGIIKYGERVWVVMLNSNDDYTGLVQLDPAKIDQCSRASGSKAKLALLAHSWLHTLRPHAEDYECDADEVATLEKQFGEKITTADEAFRLIAIELGLIYEMLFSKVGTIFTLWGSILRFLSISFLISLLVAFLMRRESHDKLPEHFKGDDVITIVLLAGAIFLDLAGIVVQLSSNWALVWACYNIDRIKWGATPVLFLHKELISDRPWWSGVIGQLSLREFCKNYKSTWCNEKWGNLFGKEKMLKRYRSKKEPVLPRDLKDLIFNSLCEMSRKRPHSGVRRADQWTLLSDDLGQQFEYWGNELEFSRSIVIWHVATEVCYLSDRDKDDTKARLVKMLSDYMMYLLVAYPSRFPFCNICGEIMKDQEPMKKLFDSCKGVKNKGNTTNTTLVNREAVENKGDSTTLVDKAQRIVQAMKEKHENSWDIMGRVWVEMMRYAAREIPVKKHIEELRCGGEFSTHVWLLLMHLGDSDKLEISHSSLADEDSKDDEVGQKDWDITRFWW
ncbi:hypothetical protein RHSIM_Rhsim07G0044800 [Rhododendron simsii]|uniref:DUF4220 domain-containing protein n=1 Tax=Rhododendron simsii TaxID=118357 RepID=A0A834GT57_RHOSS|nr:hypothetical protein RHSIM_Rhsim07G0044800 [Rhododendron simsii]